MVEANQNGKRMQKGKKKTLFTKSIRDMKKSMSQFISIFLLAMVTAIIVTGLDSLWMLSETHANQLYADTETADLWVTILNPSEQDMWKVKQIEGVKAAEKRLKVNVDADLDGDPTLTLYAASTSNLMDQPYLVQGNKDKKAGAILDKTFADAHQLSIDDTIRIKLNNRWVTYRISGLCYNSEHIFSIKDTTSMMPNPNNYGYLMVDMDSLKEVFYGNRYFNQIELSLDQGADTAAIQNELDHIFGKKLIGVQKHQDTVSFKMVNNQVKQFQLLAKVFPAMFFIVTALITLSTMIRLVEEQRNQVGVMKSLGYGKKTIIWHYTSYGVYVGVLGALFGCVLGPNIITRIILEIFKGKFYLPTYQIVLYWPNIIIISLLIVLCTGGIAAYSCFQLLDQMPAELLRAKPPKKGSHILLEKMTVIWRKMKFSSKLIARNLSRNKMRFFMSAFGIMGCTAAILAAFTLRVTLLATAENVHGEVYTYDEKMVLDGKTRDRYLENLQINADKQTILQSAMYAYSDSGARKMMPITVTSAKSPMLHLPDLQEKGEIKLSDDGVVITRKQAEAMDVVVGDHIYLKRTNDTYVPVKINEISTLKIGQGIYMTDVFYESLGETFTPSALFVKWHGEPNETAQYFIDSDRVVSNITQVKENEDINSNLRMLTVAVSLLIMFGAVLAFVVIYNMGMLNFFERVRDLSTLMVLGFYHHEIRMLVLIDNILSSLLGIALGLPFGKFLSHIIITGLGDDFDLTVKLTFANVAISAAMTLIFAGIVNLLLAKKMKQIDMLEALKSVE